MSLWCLCTFSSISFLNFGKCCRLGLPLEIKVQTSKIYETRKDRCKLFHINQTAQTTTSKETCIKFKKYRGCRLWAKIYEIYWDFLFPKNNFFTGKKPVMETILVAITDSSDVRYFDLYLINIFTKSTKLEICTDIMFKLTLYSWSVTVEDLNL